MTICLFTPYGKTFTFRNATLIADNEAVLVFDYKAMSDAQHKTHTAIKANIVGYSIS